LAPAEESGRLGIAGDPEAEPIVQFLSKDGCFLWPGEDILGDAALATAPMIEMVLNSFAELCREWCRSRIEAAEGLLVSPAELAVS
jgi:hypothetical protein